MTDARPQDILTPITESAIFLTVCVDPGGEEVAKELLPDSAGCGGRSASGRRKRG